MKKFTMIFAMFVLVLVMLFVSHSIPNKDPEKARDALKANGYDVNLEFYNDDSENIQEFEGLEASILAFAEDGTNRVAILYFENRKAANDAWDDIKKLVEEIKESDKSIISNKLGSMIYYGTLPAIQATN